jgi:hypothetical protein
MVCMPSIHEEDEQVTESQKAARLKQNTVRDRSRDCYIRGAMSFLSAFQGRDRDGNRSEIYFQGLFKPCGLEGVQKTFATDESELPQMDEASEDDDENVQLYPLQPRLPNVTVVLNSNISSSRSRDLEVRVSAAKKQSRAGIETPKTQRRKRQYEDTEDEEEYRESQQQSHRPKEHTLRPSPRTRSTSKSETGLVSPTLTPDYSNNRNEGRGRVDGESAKRQRTERKKAVRQMIEADRVQRESAEMATSLNRC